MSTRVQDVLEEARQLSPVEQLDLIRALSELLQTHYQQDSTQTQAANQDAIPATVVRAKPVTDLDEITADFWPDDESIDDFNAFIQQERAADRLSDQ